MRNEYNETINEYFDIHDRETRKVLLSINEQEQNTVLLSLTGKLYSMIVDKVTDIDFGDIPDTKGDVTMLESYTKLVDCITTITEILKEYKQPLETIDTIRAALDNLENDKAIYKKGFMADIEIVQTTYNTMVLAIINSISYLIACTIDFIKYGNSTYKISVDKMGLARTKDSLVYECLVKFNAACKHGQIEAAFKPLIRNKVKSVIGISFAAIAPVFAVCAILLSILPFLRELTYGLFALRLRISRYLDLQADLLEMNAQMLKNNEVSSVEDRNKVAQRQTAIAHRFRSMAEKLVVKTKESEKESTKMIKDDSKKMKINDVVDQLPDSIGAQYDNTLF